jgi:hypothetical protein
MPIVSISILIKSFDIKSKLAGVIGLIVLLPCTPFPISCKERDWEGELALLLIVLIVPMPVLPFMPPVPFLSCNPLGTRIQGRIRGRDYGEGRGEGFGRPRQGWIWAN